MTEKIITAIAIALFAFLFQCTSSRATTKRDTFDHPLKIQVKVLGPSPYYPSGRYQKKLKLYCYFYSNLLVKEYDEGQKGAEWLSFARLEQGRSRRCELSHDPDEHVIDPNDWSGYFKGVKGSLVFFSAADGTDGGMPFVIFDSNTGKKVFEDSAYDPLIWRNSQTKPQDSPFNRLRIYKAEDRGMTLKYLRVVGTDCDLHSEGSSCWEQLRSSLQLRQTKMPVCSNYENISVRYSSSLAYPVETVLFPEPATKTTEGPIKCWPVD